MCSVLRVSRSGFYEWLRRHNYVAERQINNFTTGKQIQEIFTDIKLCYGVVRIRRELLKEGGQSEANFGIVANTLKRGGVRITPNAVLAADIADIKTDGGWLYLAAILDLCYCKAVGPNLSPRIDSDLIIGVLDKALT